MEETAEKPAEKKRAVAVVKLPLPIYEAVKAAKEYEQEPLWHVVERGLMAMGKMTLAGVKGERPRGKGKPEHARGRRRGPSRRQKKR